MMARRITTWRRVGEAVAMLLLVGASSARADRLTVSLPNPVIELARGATTTVVFRLVNTDSVDIYLNGAALGAGEGIELAADFTPLLTNAPTMLHPRELWEGPAVTITGPTAGDPDSLIACLSLVGGHLIESAEVLGTACFLAVLSAPPCPNQLVEQPADLTVRAGRPASLTCLPAGGGPFTYQWRFNGIPILDGPTASGAETSQLVLAAAAPPDTGDYDVVVTGPCGVVTSRAARLRLRSSSLPVPPYLTAWWSFDDEANGNVFGDLVVPDLSRHALEGQGPAERGSGVVGGGLDLEAVGSAMSSPEATPFELGFGGGPFTIDAWVYLDPGAGPTVRRAIVVRRVDASGPRPGYAFYIQQNRLRLQLGDAATTTEFASPVVLSDGAWHHVGVAVDPIGLSGAFYADGEPAGTFQPARFSDPAGIRLTIGGGTSAEWGSFTGRIDEVHLFRRPLAAPVMRAIWAAGVLGLARESVVAPAVVRFLPGEPDRRFSFAFRTWGWTGAAFGWRLTNTPPDEGCPGAAPIEAFPALGELTLPVNGNQEVLSTLYPGASATSGRCFRLAGDVAPLSRNVEADGMLLDGNLPLRIRPVGPVLQAIPAAGGTVTFRVHNDSTESVTLGYRLSSRIRSEIDAIPVLRIGGGFPGAPWTAQVTVPPLDSVTVAIPVRFDGPQPFIEADVLFETQDGEAELHPVASLALTALPDSLGVSGIPDAPFVNSTSFEGLPNPFVGSTLFRFTLASRQAVHAEIFDVGGRLVRSLHSGIMEAGPHEMPWDGRNVAGDDCSGGVYFARIRTPEFQLTTKLVRLR